MTMNNNMKEFNVHNSNFYFITIYYNYNKNIFSYLVMNWICVFLIVVLLIIIYFLSIRRINNFQESFRESQSPLSTMTKTVEGSKPYSQYSDYSSFKI